MSLIVLVKAVTVSTAAAATAAVSIIPVKWIAVIYRYIKPLKDFYGSRYILLYLIISI